MTYHYSQEQIDAAVEAILARVRENAPATDGGQMRKRAYEALVPVLIQNQMDEMNAGADLSVHVAHTLDVFGWWLAHLARNFTDSDAHAHVQFIMAGCSDVGNAAISKLSGASVAKVQGNTGGRA